MKKYIVFFAALFLCSCFSSKEKLKEEMKAGTNKYATNNIKECILTEYSYKFGELDSLSGVLMERHIYNDKGLCVQDSVYGNITKYVYNDALLVEETTYDLSGEMIRKTKTSYEDNVRTDSLYSKEGNLSFCFEKFRDENGNDTLNIGYSSERGWDLYSKDVCVYDTIGFKYGIFEHFDIKDFVWKHERKRINEDPYLQQTEEWNLGREVFLVLSETKVFNTNMDIIEYISKNPRLNVFERYRIEYDQNKFPVKKIYYNEAEEPVKQIVYEYIWW